MTNEVPKARELFSGDINDAVKRVQQATGVHIDEAWWSSMVGNEGTTEQILDRFDIAYSEELNKTSKGPNL